jgi:hypothetical protein
MKGLGEPAPSREPVRKIPRRLAGVGADVDQPDRLNSERHGCLIVPLVEQGIIRLALGAFRGQTAAELFVGAALPAVAKDAEHRFAQNDQNRTHEGEAEDEEDHFGLSPERQQADDAGDEKGDENTHETSFQEMMTVMCRTDGYLMMILSSARQGDPLLRRRGRAQNRTGIFETRDVGFGANERGPEPGRVAAHMEPQPAEAHLGVAVLIFSAVWAGNH